MQVELELRMKSLFARDKNTGNKKKKKNHQWSSRLQAVCKMGATFVSTGIGQDRTMGECIVCICLLSGPS